MTTIIDRPELLILPDISLADGYQQEHEKKLSLLGGKIESPSPYLTEEQACHYQVNLSRENNGFVDINDVILDDGNYLFTVINYFDAKTNQATRKYYVSLDGELEGEAQALPGKLAKVPNHPNFIRGAAVAFAGFIEIKNAMLAKIDNNSGHYKLTFEQASSFIATLILDLELEMMVFVDYSPMLGKLPKRTYTVEPGIDFEKVSFLSDSVSNDVVSNDGCDVLKAATGYQASKNQVSGGRYTANSSFFQDFALFNSNGNDEGNTTNVFRVG